MKRKATAQWKGSLEKGQGNITSGSRVLSETPYSYGTRFQDGDGTNPEELIAAANAGCFSMALAMILGQHNLEPENIRTRANVSLEQTDEGFAITAVHLEVNARVPGADNQTFEQAAEQAKASCPVSKVLNAEITMNATLES